LLNAVKARRLANILPSRSATRPEYWTRSWQMRT
jgi:hypothetical protein